jgi:hypothetical protein
MPGNIPHSDINIAITELFYYLQILFSSFKKKPVYGFILNISFW